MADKALEIIRMDDPSRYGLEPEILSVGDTVLEVSGHPARDPLDFIYYTSLETQGDSGESIQLKVIRKNGTHRDILIDPDLLHQLNIVFSPIDFKRCRCKCPFCFVDQMPAGMRESLYIKDEDYRLSFLYGNYTTMNDVTEADIDRMIEQRTSPQYVSVHAVDEKMREWIFGRPMKNDILETLKTLADGGITIHTQVVLCPGKNDRFYLDETISTLEALHPNITSLAVVPVGLTRHRQGLTKLRPYESEEMEAVIEQVEAYQDLFLESARQSRFVFLSDEWYLEANHEIPAYETYEDFSQIDNGVGMVRFFSQDILESIKSSLRSDGLDRIQIVTGALGEKTFTRYVFPLLSEHVERLPHVLSVKNRFFGETVTCSGLLTFHDIADALKQTESNGMVALLPPNVLNYEGRFLEGPALEDLEKTTSRRVVVPEDTSIGISKEPGLTED